MENLNSSYGMAKASGLPFTVGNVFFVSDANDTANFNNIDLLFKPDKNGLVRRYSNFTNALAQCVAGRGDVIIVSPAFETALTSAELLSAETKGVLIVPANTGKDGSVLVHRATSALPQTAQGSLFTVTGRIELEMILGTVTTVIQTQLNNAKLVANPTVGADVDLCSVLNITGDAVGTVYSLTGTLSDALVATTSGAVGKQAGPIIVEAGSIDLNCSASNTGSVKWLLKYKALDLGARVFSA